MIWIHMNMHANCLFEVTGREIQIVKPLFAFSIYFWNGKFLKIRPRNHNFNHSFESFIPAYDWATRWRKDVKNHPADFNLRFSHSNDDFLLIWI